MANGSLFTRIRSIARGPFAGAALVLGAHAAHAQLEPTRLYYGVDRPAPMEVLVPAGATGEVEILLLRPETAKAAGRASAAAGPVDMATLFPALWTEKPKDVLYAQLVVGGEKIGPAVVIQPLVEPSRAIRREHQAVFPDSGPETYSGFRAYADTHLVFETTEGDLTIALRPDHAPNTCWTIRHLVEGGFYTDILAHRILADRGDGTPFVAQLGCPRGEGTGGPGFSIDLEDSKLPHAFGVVSMARTADLDSNGSQLFFCLSRKGTSVLDGQYTAFAQMVGGASALLAIEAAEVNSAGMPLNKAAGPRIVRAYTVPAPPYGKGPKPSTRPAE